MKKFFTILLLLAILASFPLVTLSAYFVPMGITTFNGLFATVLNFLWKVFAALAVISFIVAGIYFILAQGQPEKIETAKRFVVWGVVGIIVAILSFSIVKIIINAF